MNGNKLPVLRYSLLSLFSKVNVVRLAQPLTRDPNVFISVVVAVFWQENCWGGERERGRLKVEACVIHDVIG